MGNKKILNINAIEMHASGSQSLLKIRFLSHGNRRNAWSHNARWGIIKGEQGFGAQKIKKISIWHFLAALAKELWNYVLGE